MAQILPNHSTEIGRILGTGLGNSLRGLAQNKTDELKQRQLAQGLQGLATTRGKQLSPEIANALSRLTPELLQQYVQGEYNPRSNQQQIGANGQPIKRPLTVAEQTHHDALNEQFNNLETLVGATDRSLELLKEGKGGQGAVAHLIGQTPLRGTLADETQQLLGEYNKVLNVLTANEKGLRSNARIKNLEKDKLSLDLSRKEQIRRAELANKLAKHELKQLRENYPDIEFKSLLDEANQPGYELGGQPRQQQQPFEIGSEIDEPPLPGTAEFNALPDGYRFDNRDGVIIRKVGNTYEKE